MATINVSNSDIRSTSSNFANTTSKTVYSLKKNIEINGLVDFSVVDPNKRYMFIN